MENIIGKAKQIHKDNVKKGFWDNKTPASRTIECLALIHSEVSEALESYRSGKWANIEDFEHQKTSWIFDYTADFKNYIKDTVEDELADAVIRILDLIGAWDIVEKIQEEINVREIHFTDVDFYNMVVNVHAEITYSADHYGEPDNLFEEGLALQLITLKAMTDYLKIDLEKHIDMKLEYNKSREYKHGKIC